MPTSSSSLRSAERLFFGASWALSHGDAGGLAQVVADLAAGFTGELQKELRKELLELSMQCHVDYDGAVHRWPAVCAHAHAVLEGAHSIEAEAVRAKGTTEMAAQSISQPEASRAASLPRPTIIPVIAPVRSTPSTEQATQPITPLSRRRRLIPSRD